MVSNAALYHSAISEGLQSYIKVDRFAPSRWAAPGVLPVFDEDSKKCEPFGIFDQENLDKGFADDGYEDDDIEDGVPIIIANSKTLPMHPVRELQEWCQQQAEGLEYKATRRANLATVEVYIDGVQFGTAQNTQKKMAQKLAARSALVVFEEKEEAKVKKDIDENGKKKNRSSHLLAEAHASVTCLAVDFTC